MREREGRRERDGGPEGGGEAQHQRGEAGGEEGPTEPGLCS